MLQDIVEYTLPEVPIWDAWSPRSHVIEGLDYLFLSEHGPTNTISRLRGIEIK